MKDFNYYLDHIGEIGFVEQSVHSLVYVSGLPEAHTNEVVIFESGDIGHGGKIHDGGCRFTAGEARGLGGHNQAGRSRPEAALHHRPHHDLKSHAAGPRKKVGCCEIWLLICYKR